MGEVKDIMVFMMWKEPAPDGLALPVKLENYTVRLWAEDRRKRS